MYGGYDYIIMQQAAHSPCPVSYTHLDVYKRQGLIITGAPVEKMEFEEVEYWEELTEIMEWSKHHVHSTCLLYTSRCV